MERTKIIVDTRERTPWTFEGIPGLTLERAKLNSGDYSVAGLEARVAVERKSLEDFLGTVLRDRRRFYRELERLRAFEFRCVMIETSVAEIHSHRIADRVSPASVMGFIAEIAVAQCVPVYLAGTRAEAQVLAAAFLKMAAKKLRISVEKSGEPE